MEVIDMIEKIKFMILVWIRDLDALHVTFNAAMLVFTLTSSFYVFQYIDERLGSTGKYGTSNIVSIDFIAGYDTLIGKTVARYDDMWLIDVGKGVRCRSAVGGFLVGQDVSFTYTVGWFTGHKYCKGVKPYENE
jgi:hypothetical protein